MGSSVISLCRCCELVNCERVVQHVFDAAGVSELYAEMDTWELFEKVADAFVLDSDPNPYVDNPAMDDDDDNDEDARTPSGFNLGQAC